LGFFIDKFSKIRLMKKLLFTIITLSLVLLFSCKEEEERRLGDHTISFYLDGKLWQNSKGNSVTGGISLASYSFYGEGENIRAVDASNWDKGTMYLSMSQRGDNGIYLLGNNNGIYGYGSDPFDTNLMPLRNHDKMYLSKEGYGWAEITVDYYDTINNIRHYEGIFEATLFNENDSTDVIHITDGRWNN